MMVLFGCTHAATSTTPVVTGPRTLVKGASFDGILHHGDDHAFLIDMQPGEDLHVDLVGESGKNVEHAGCGNWGWEWRQPEGGTVTSNPLGLAPNEDGTGARPGSIDVSAKIAEAGDFAPHGGRWSFHLLADPANCEELRYHLSAR